MKKLLATLVIAAAAITPAAITAETTLLFNTLCINRVDGVTEHLQLDAEMTVTMTGDGVIRMAHPRITVEYPSAEVSHFTFDDAENPVLYDGDYEASIETPAIDERKILISDNEIRVSGTDGITVYDLRGVEIARIQAADGTATLRIGDFSSGVYILRTGTTSVKIKL